MAHSDVLSAPERPGPTTALTRVADVMLDPVAAFRGIDTRATWVVAFLALVLLRFVSVLAFYNPDTTAGKLLAGILFQLVTTFPLMALLATLLRAAAAASSARMTWAGAWCVTVHVTFAYTLVTVAIASVAGALLPGSVEVELRHPPFTNLASLVDESDSPVSHALAREADVRSLYAAMLSWIGVRSASGGNGRAATRIVATCWAIFVFAAVMSAAVRS